MDKGEIAFYISGILLSLAWVVMFKKFGSAYYIVISIYSGVFFSTLGYFDYKKENRVKSK